MQKGKIEGHEVVIKNVNKINSNQFGLSGLGVNTTKKDNRKDSRIKEDISSKY